MILTCNSLHHTCCTSEAKKNCYWTQLWTLLKAVTTCSNLRTPLHLLSFTFQPAHGKHNRVTTTLLTAGKDLHTSTTVVGQLWRGIQNTQLKIWRYIVQCCIIWHTHTHTHSEDWLMNQITQHWVPCKLEDRHTTPPKASYISAHQTLQSKILYSQTGKDLHTSRVAVRRQYPKLHFTYKPAHLL